MPRARSPVQDVLLRLVPFRVVSLGDGDRTVTESTAHLANVHARFAQLNGEIF